MKYSISLRPAAKQAGGSAVQRWVFLAGWIRFVALGLTVSVGRAEPPRFELRPTDPARLVPAGNGGIAEGFALLPPGLVAAGEPIHLATVTGRRLPTTVRVTGVHPDGSARGLALRATLPRDLKGRASVLRLGAGQGAPPLDRVTIRDLATGFVVATGGMTWEFAQGGMDPLPRIDRANVPVKDPSRPLRVSGRCRDRVVSSDLAARAGVLPTSSVALHDDLAATIVVRLPLADAEGVVRMNAALELGFRAGSSAVDFAACFAATDADRFADLAFELPLRFRSHESYRGSFVPTDGREVALGASARLLVLALDGRGVFATTEEGEAALDPAARCGVAVRGGPLGAATVAVVGSRLRPLAPRAIEAVGDGRIVFTVLRGETFFTATQRIAAEGALAVAASDERAALLGWLAREPLPALVAYDPRALDGAVAGSVDPQDPNDPLPRSLAKLDTAVGALAGWRDYGDYRLGGGYANLEYDAALPFALMALGAGDARHVLVARDMISHFVAHDLSRGEAGVPVGFPWQHGDDHASHEFEPGHVFLGGLAFAALCDDPRGCRGALGAARDALDVVVADGTAFRHERDFGWALIAYADSAQVFGPGAVTFGVFRLGDRLLDSQAARGFFAIDRPNPQDTDSGPRGAWVATPWVTAGITIEALHRWRSLAAGTVPTVPPVEPGLASDADPFAGESPRRRIEGAVRRALEFLLRDARYENGEFAASVEYDAPGAVVVTRNGVADPVDRLLIAAGLLRAAAILGDGALADLADREVVVAASRMKRLPLGPNDSARALVAWRMIRDAQLRRTLR